MATILAFETATQACSASLLHSGRRFDRFEIAPRRSSELILQMITDLLKEAKISLSALDVIALGYGPGSFMGIRLAIGVAQGLAFGTKKPVIPLSTLQILAQSGHAHLKSKKILVAWDARMGQIYWGAYQLDVDGLMQPLQKDQLSSPNAVDLYEYGRKREGWLFAGNGWSSYFDQFSPKTQNLFKEHNREQELIYPHAKDMITIANQKFLNHASIDIRELKPCYLRDQVTN